MIVCIQVQHFMRKSCNFKKSLELSTKFHGVFLKTVISKMSVVYPKLSVRFILTFSSVSVSLRQSGIQLWMMSGVVTYSRPHMSVSSCERFGFLPHSPLLLVDLSTVDLLTSLVLSTNPLWFAKSGRESGSH